MLTQEEIVRLRTKIDDDYPYYGEVSFVPMAWATMTLRKAFDEGHICPSGSNDLKHSYPTVINFAIEALRDYRLQYGTMLFEVYFPFPLLLSQLVTIVTYSYFFVALVAQQNTTEEPQFIFPIFTAMEFVVYIGALRVGQTFTNPLGEGKYFKAKKRVMHCVYGKHRS